MGLDCYALRIVIGAALVFAAIRYGRYRERKKHGID